jgi:hypothetical protein
MKARARGSFSADSARTMPFAYTAAAAPQKAIDKTDGCHFSPCVLFLFGCGDAWREIRLKHLKGYGVRFILLLRESYCLFLYN